MWISNAIDKGLILPSRAAHHSGGPEAATEWMNANYEIIPENLRPSRPGIDEFAAFFSTYLTSSFDVIQKPGTKGAGPIPRFACRCDLCFRIVNAPHLQAKKLYARDRSRADTLMSECLQTLASKHGIELDEKSATKLLTDQRTRRSVQYISWPENTWDKLRKENPGKFEKPISPVPNPNDWFHARIEVTQKEVRVFVNEAKEPCLTVDRLMSGQGKQPMGLFVDVAEGLYANVKVTTSNL